MLSAHLAGGDPVAVPIQSIDAVVERISSGRTLRRAYLGVSTQPVELQEVLRERLGLAQSTGLMLLALEPDAPAERGGLFLGDILVAIGGRTVEDGEALQMALGPDAIGKSTPIKLIRGGELRELAVVPAPRPN
jgi:S1-C subfamily serine protease